MSDAPAAPTLGERKTQQAIERIKTKIADSDERGIRAAEPLSVGLRVDLDVALALIESQSAEIASLRELRKVAARNAGAADRARFDAERKLAAATEALRACVSVLTDKVVGTIYGDDPNWYRALDDAVALALPLLDAQPEQGAGK